MSFFTPVGESKVILHKNGEYTEAPVYQLKLNLFAKLGTKYVRLKRTKGTSIDRMSWVDVHVDPSFGSLGFDAFDAVLVQIENKSSRTTPKKRGGSTK